MALLTLTDVAKTYDANYPLFSDVSFVVRDADRIGLIGPNGAGKSTLLRLMAGLEPPDAGKRVVRRDTEIGFLEQEPSFARERSVREVVRSGLAGREELLAEIEGHHRELERGDQEPAELERLLRRTQRLEDRLEELGGHDVEHRVAATLEGVGLRDPGALCGTLSGGEARRVALARLLISTPDLLLLDEPTNHLDAFVVAWLEERLQRLRVPLVLVTHDRYLLDRVVGRIVEIDRGRAYTYEGGYSRYVQLRTGRLESERTAERSRLNLLRREAEWMRRGPPARTTKSKARIARYEALESGAATALPDDLEMMFPRGPRLGARVATLRGVSHAYDGKAVVPRLDLELQQGMRLGIVGPNGAGKTTLARILLGRLAPDEGEVTVGETVRFATMDQSREDLDPKKSVVEEIAGKVDHVMVGERRVHVAGFLDRFLFPGPRKDVRVGDLSGGERGRVLLGKLLLKGANVLVLDEPTNDLDLMTLRALEEALCAFEGAVVVISHDRWFLDRVATHVLYLDGRGGWRLHSGDVSSLLDRLAREEAERESAGARSKPRKARSKPSTPPERKPLASWERRELEEVLAKVTELEETLGEIDRELADPGVYERGSGRARDLHARRKVTVEALDGAMVRFEELAERDR